MVIHSTEESYNNSGARELGSKGETRNSLASSPERNSIWISSHKVQCNSVQAFPWKSDTVATHRLYSPMQSSKSAAFFLSLPYIPGLIVRLEVSSIQILEARSNYLWDHLGFSEVQTMTPGVTQRSSWGSYGTQVFPGVITTAKVFRIGNSHSSFKSLSPFQSNFSKWEFFFLWIS